MIFDNRQAKPLSCQSIRQIARRICTSKTPAQLRLWTTEGSTDIDRNTKRFDVFVGIGNARFLEAFAVLMFVALVRHTRSVFPRRRVVPYASSLREQAT
jgi:hypothetical protein